MLPFEVATRTNDGRTGYGIGTAILLNSDGWILTAGHILSSIDKASKDVAHKHRADAIRNDASLSSQDKQKALRALGKIGPKGVTNYAFRIGRQKVGTLHSHILPEKTDAGLAKIDKFVVPHNYQQPVLRTKPIEIGEMICRAGFPFYTINRLVWDEKTKTFISDDGLDKTVPVFVNEGIVSRFNTFIMQDSSTGLRVDPPVKWIETSSPGIKGQSGGPLLDQAGMVCGMQINTKAYPLDFNAQSKDGKTIPQFLNVGRAVHVETIRSYLDKLNIHYLHEK